MQAKVNQYSEPITLWLHALDEENLKLTLQFLLINESDTEDRFNEFEIDNGLQFDKFNQSKGCCLNN